MKRFVNIVLLSAAMLLGHSLFYASESDYQYVGHSADSDENYIAIPGTGGYSSDATFLDYEDGYTFRTRTVTSSTTKHQECAGHIIPAPQSKKIQTTVTTSSLGILKYGRLLNSNKLYDFLNTLSYHTSGVRASADRLFTLESVRC